MTHIAKNCIKCNWPFHCPVEQRFRVMCRACETQAIDKIDITEALRLYHVWRSWREVAFRMVRKNGMRFATDAVQRAVRQYDRRPA
jgi:hypothetical protein